MSATFDAEEFVVDLKSGKFDGRLIAEFRKLSTEELEEVVNLVVEERVKKKLLDTARGFDCVCAAEPLNLSVRLTAVFCDVVHEGLQRLLALCAVSCVN